MIVREIKQNPDEVIKTFDWFNDYKDTRQWCVYSCPEILGKLDDGFRDWNGLLIAKPNIHNKA